MKNQIELSLLPGPVSLLSDVKEALAEPPIHHRSREFISIYRKVKLLLCQLVNARHSELLLGSGTLANDAVAAQLSVLNEHGLIINGGEFGERLVDHARRFNLSFDSLELGLRATHAEERILQAIDPKRHRWVWAVHCETSTGALLDLTKLSSEIASLGTRLCIDCVSTLGTMPLDLQGVYLATSASGKGIGSFSGVSFVFHHHDILQAVNHLPRYLDLGLYSSAVEPPFTFSSNLLRALHAALQYREWRDHFNHIQDLSQWTRRKIRRMGFRILIPDERSSPAVTTIALPKTIGSRRLGDQLASIGFRLSYASEYLVRHNWIQIVLMGECVKEDVRPLFKWMERLVTGKNARIR
jgi:aspartate aminotransferase-like enzyme